MLTLFFHTFMVKTFKSFVCELKRSAGMVSIYFTQGKNLTRLNLEMVFFFVCPRRFYQRQHSPAFCVFNLQMLCTVIVLFSVKLHLYGNSFIQLVTCILEN